MKKTLCFLISIFLIGCENIDKKQSNKIDLMTDEEMIDYLHKHRADFDSLRTWIVEDKRIEFMLLNSSDDRYLNSITQERAGTYFNLMNKLSIESLSRGNGCRNAIIFYLPQIKDNDKTINKGYVYKIDPNKDKEEFMLFRANGEDKDTPFVRTDGDILTETEQLDLGTFVYKPIDEHWSLICLIL